MKPASVISLVISVIIIVIGLVTCMIAQNMANANGEVLFTEDSSDGLPTTIDLSDVDVSKIELIVSDADINIYGRSSSNYVEFYNYRENYYTATTANRVFSFDEIPDIVSMLKFWENGFSFKGIRYLINFHPETEGRKVINVYTTSDSGIKIFNIQATNCNLNLENLTTGSDYDISIDTGTVNVTSLKTSSMFKLTGNDITLTGSYGNMTNVEIDVDNLNMDFPYFVASGVATINCSTGHVNISTPRSSDGIYLTIESDIGEIKVNDQVQTSPFENIIESADKYNLTITTKSADVSVTLNDSN